MTMYWQTQDNHNDAAVTE